ncbi:hypothetical protein QAO71_17850 (plasmid) [Halopseudomonas sp. SMJS2]|uniref:hypothetical protein n=1 Tax=Halopseudomonas sp. SMJS2 TaxID=3041098 RepID=UPI002452B34F|nr:hypothetical protein [Halopseudomonas sp. SMJS2]WGK63406.1 hypothetical protein QAO71_17850 [Halopseudomonas sp. SMJS2]
MISSSLLRAIPLVAALMSGYAYAVPVVEVSVSQGDSHIYHSYTELTAGRHSIDLRDAIPYQIAVKDQVRNRDICRESDYRPGLFLTFRDTGEGTDGSYNMEVIGQVSSLKSMTPGEILSCGQNTVVEMETKAFSDTSQIQVGKPKVIVIDNSWTVLVTINE